MIFVGIDYSMTSPAVTIIDGDNIEYHFRYNYPKRKKVDLPKCFFPEPTCDSVDDVYRYTNNAEWVMKCIGDRECVVVIEGYSYGSAGQVFNLAENCGILKYILRKNGIKFSTPSPGTIKKFFTGKGNATKEFMTYTFCEKSGHDLYKIFNRESLGGPMADIADSYAMAMYCKQEFERNDEKYSTETKSMVRS